MTTSIEQETASIVEVPRPEASTACARLVVVHPAALTDVLPLTGAEAVLGRGEGTQGTLRIDHPTVSRKHAVVRWDPVAGRHQLVDLGSRNGTWLEGSPVGALPYYLADQAVLRLGDVLAVYERDDRALVQAPGVSHEAVPGISLATCHLRVAIARAARDPAPALIEGETGVGKERIAEELHRISGRSGPLVVINCAALSASLIDSQLFGHTRGAFTGANHEHPGLFRSATGGTLFLDELGELPLELQPKLLRAVELGELVAVGSSQSVRVDVRVIAATNRALADEVAAGKFRRDLHARMSLTTIKVPPLRARRSDLIAWFDRMHRAWCAARKHAHVPPLELQTDAALALLLQPWPDNLRGLQRIIHGCATASSRPPLSRSELLPWFADPGPTHDAAAPEGPPSPAPGPRTRRPRPSRDDLLAALTDHGWSIRATARHFGCERKQISRWIEMYTLAAHRPADSGDELDGGA